MGRSIPTPTIRGALFALVALAFVPLLLFTGWEVAQDRARYRDAETRASRELAQSIAAAAEAFVHDLARTEHGLGALFVAQGSTASDVERALALVVAAHAAVRDMSWLDRDGLVVASTEPELVGRSLFARDYFQELAHGAEWRVSPLLRSVVDERPTFVVARAIRDGSGAFAWVMTAAVDADQFGAVVLTERGRHGFTSIRDSQGALVALTPPRAVSWEDRHRGADGEWVRQALSGREGVGPYVSPLTGERRVGAILPIATLGWVASASRSSDEALAPFRRRALLHAGVLLLVAVTALAAALAVARRIAHPLRALEAEAERLAQGGVPGEELSGPVETRRVASALRAMATGLAERRAELDRLQDERETLMRSVSHDLRTPLNVIVGQAALIQRRTDHVETRDRAAAILASAGRMTRLISDLVEAARLDAGHVELRLEPLDLGNFLVDWRERVASALDVDRVRIDVRGPIPAIRADPARLDQIVGNLVSNSLKYSVPGSEVRVELAATPAELRLAVRDRGPGIAQHELARLFERYYRAEGSAAAEGLGLGLFITRKLVDAHGWRIEVESELGTGSVFTVVVPVAGGRAAHAPAAVA